MPNFPVSVDTAVLTVGSDATLQVVQVRRPGERGWALPGTALRKGERLIDAVLRSLHDLVGVEGLVPHQLHAFDVDGAITVAYAMLVPEDLLAARSAESRVVAAAAPGRLPAGQAAIVGLAVEDAQRRYAAGPDPDGLLPEPFTILDLRRLHAAVAGRELQKDTFRRAVQEHLVETGEASSGTRGRPAALYRVSS